MNTLSLQHFTRNWLGDKKKCDLFQSTDKAYSSAIGCYVDSAPMTPADTNLYTIKRHRAIVTQNKNKLSLSQCILLNLCDVLGKNGLWAVHKIARTKCIQFYELHFGFFFRVYFLFEIDFFFHLPSIQFGYSQINHTRKK